MINLDYFRMDQYMDEIRFYSFDVFRYVTTERKGDNKLEVIEDAKGIRRKVNVDEVRNFSQLGINYNIWIFLLPIRIILYTAVIIYSLERGINVTSIVSSITCLVLLFIRFKQLGKYIYFRDIINNNTEFI